MKGSSRSMYRILKDIIESLINLTLLDFLLINIIFVVKIRILKDVHSCVDLKSRHYDAGVHLRCSNSTVLYLSLSLMHGDLHSSVAKIISNVILVHLINFLIKTLK